MRTAVVLFLAGVCSVYLQAEEKGFYIGAGIGWSELEDSYMDEDSLGFKVFSGYKFNRFLSLELGLADLGTFGEKEKKFISADLPVELSSNLFSSSVILSYLSENRFSLYARFGCTYHRDDVTYTDGTNRFSTTEADEFDLSGGIGTLFTITDHFSLRGEWERYKLNQTHVDTVTLGFYYRF
ncbi:MAG: hypothetical protein CSA81_01865 [Acidobacteria bacterium]|nr:MAG: hypothetical protein CSA81_01865 [Acidobacteriota bacterium]